MKLLKTDKRLIDEGYQYKIEGDLVSDESIDLTDLGKPLYVTGSIKAGGSLDAGTVVGGGVVEYGVLVETGKEKATCEGKTVEIDGVTYELRAV